METKRIKILAIDDYQDNLIILKALIKEAFPDAITLTASNGKKGIELAVSEDPDVILLDIVMPVMDGFVVCKKLKSDKKTCDIPVVFVTAIKDDKDSRIRALEYGAEAFLAKPIDESELKAQIRAMVKIKKANSEKRDENDRLAALVIERTLDLEFELNERVKAEISMRESEERFRSVTQSANDAIITTDSEGLVMGWNQGAEKIFGYSEAEITNQKLTLIIPQKYEKLHLDGLQKTSNQGKNRVIGKTVELFGLHKNGNEIPIELSLAEWENASGKYFTGIIRDISQRKMMEDQLNETLKELKLSQSIAQVGNWKLDLETRFFIASDEGLRLFGFPLNSKPHFDDISDCIHPQHRNLVLETLNQALLTKQKFSVEILIHKKDTGELRNILSIGDVQCNADGKPVALVGINQDITVQKQATEALRASEEKYRTIFNSVQDVFYQTDFDGTIRDVSPSIRQFLGFSTEELLGGPVAILYYDKNDREKLLEKIRTDGGLKDDEIRLKSKSGELKYASINAGAVLDKNNNPIYINGSLRDITARKLAELALQAIETNYRDLVLKMPDGVYKSTEAGRFISTNPALATMLGYDSVEELMAVDIKKELYFDESDREMVELKEGSTEIGIYRLRKKDGSELWVEDHGWLVFDQDDNTLFHEGIMRDVTDRKKAEDALLHEQIFSKSVIDSLPGVFYLYSYPELRLVLWNRQHETLFGFEPGEIANRHFTEWYLPEAQPLALSTIDDVMHVGNGSFESFVLTKDREPLPYFFTAVAFESQGKRYLMGTGIDISERKKAEFDLIIARDRAEESDRLKSAFLANMSHEIRTPMNGILGFAELLKIPDLTGDQQQEYIGLIKKSGDRMLNIINDIVDISKIESGLVKIDYKESDLNRQTEYIYNFFKSEAESKGISLSYKNGVQTKEFIIRTDREKLYAILTNLVKNAIKFTSTGTIEFGYVTSKAKAADESMSISQNELGRQCELSFYVKDTGIGIPKSRHKDIFDRFIQADIADTRAFQGAGLGLSISKAYVEMLGGKIWVESEEGKGSDFYFTLPCQRLSDEKPSLKTAVLTQEAQAHINNLKVLIAEDDAASEMLITIVLQPFSKEILKAGNGIEAIETCRNNPDIDLLLMDVKMPVMDGYEATRQIREFNQNIVIIAQTAYGLSGDKELAILAGCNDYISKPIGLPALRELIQKYFSR